MLILDSLKWVTLLMIIFVAPPIISSGCGDLDAKADTNIESNIDVPIVSPDISTKADVTMEKTGDAGRDSNQTSNIGFMSGGAPWLFLVIAMILYTQKTSQLTKVKKDYAKAEASVQGLKDKVSSLKKHNNELRVQQIEKVLSNEKEQE